MSDPRYSYSEMTTRDLIALILGRLDRLHQQVETLSSVTGRLEHRMERALMDLTRLQQEVNDVSTAVDSAVTLIEGIAAQIRELPATQAAINGFADQLDAKAAALAAAVTANTAAEDEPPPVEEPVE